jgi:hypothetical protein
MLRANQCNRERGGDKMAEKIYGGNKPSYGVTEREDGCIELRVYHDNTKEMRPKLAKHIHRPSELLQHYAAYSRSSIRAKYWLARVVDDYRPYFLQDRVKIMLDPSTTPVAAVAPPVPARPHDSPAKQGLRTATPSVTRGLTAQEACAALHEVLDALPQLVSPAQVPFADGLYFFYEEGETSGHAPNGRIVRVGNHPRKQGWLVSRLRMHYSGNKNSSVFRKFLGGALLRRDNPSNPCLSPAPGKGHWENGNAKACPRCRPTEARVSELLRQRFTFRCVRVPDLVERTGFEALLVATLAACEVCCPSSSWLGLYAYSEKVRASGLWNSQYVGDATIDQSNLGRFQELVSASVEPFTRLKKNI